MRAGKVLIETYWNVNQAGVNNIQDMDYVLIETYWNVNPVSELGLRYIVPGLNRNILECKWSSAQHTWSSGVVLIETYWNVNRSETSRVSAN